METVYKKIEKLLALGASSNEHEASLALVKANELMQKHNIDVASLKTTDKSEILRVQIFTGISKRPAIHKAIARILETFGVYVVLNNGTGGGIYLFGTKDNLQVAEYTANFLTTELPRLFKKAQLPLPDRKSFFFGVTDGYIASLAKAQTNTTALIVTAEVARKKVHEDYSIVAGSVSYKRNNSYTKGYVAGENLSVNKAVSI